MSGPNLTEDEHDVTLNEEQSTLIRRPCRLNRCGSIRIRLPSRRTSPRTSPTRRSTSTPTIGAVGADQPRDRAVAATNQRRCPVPAATAEHPSDDPACERPAAEQGNVRAGEHNHSRSLRLSRTDAAGTASRRTPRREDECERDRIHPRARGRAGGVHAPIIHRCSRPALGAGHADRGMSLCDHERIRRTHRGEPFTGTVLSRTAGSRNSAPTSDFACRQVDAVGSGSCPASSMLTPLGARSRAEARMGPTVTAQVRAIDAINLGLAFATP